MIDLCVYVFCAIRIALCQHTRMPIDLVPNFFTFMIICFRLAFILKFALRTVIESLTNNYNGSDYTANQNLLKTYTDKTLLINKQRAISLYDKIDSYCVFFARVASTFDQILT